MGRQLKGKHQAGEQRVLIEQAPSLVSQPLLLTVSQVAFALGLGRTKVYGLIANGDLPFVEIGSVKRVSLISLQKWIEQREKHTFV